MAIEFLIDDAEREAEELKSIEKEIKKPRKESKNTRILRRFVIALYHAGHLRHKKQIQGIKEEALRKIVERQLSQRIRQIEKPRIIEPSFKPSSFVPEKEFEKELPPPPTPIRIKRFEETENRYPLVVLKHNNKVMASAFVNDEYELVEPKLDTIDIEILRRIERVPEKNFENSLKKLCNQSGVKFSENYADKIRYFLKRELGKIGPLLKDSKITLISADGIEKNVKIIYNGKNLSTNINFTSVEEINDIIRRLAKKLGREATIYTPLEGTLPTGHRVQATLGSDEITPRFMIEKK